MSTAQKTNTPKYLILSAIVLGLAALLAFTLSSRLERDQPKAQSATQSTVQSTAQTAAPADGSLEGRPAPAFTVTDLKGGKVSLADYRGKVVFLNFWATWCEPCKTEMPSMERLYQKMKGRPFEILALSLDANPGKDIPAFLAKTKLALSFPLLADPGMSVSKDLYRTTGVPESFLIGADGMVIKHVIGIYEWDSPPIVEYFESLLKAVEASAPRPHRG